MKSVLITSSELFLKDILMKEKSNNEIINFGTGVDTSI